MVNATNPQPSISPTYKRRKVICRISGCVNGAKSQGLCKRHGGGTRCNVKGCKTAAKAENLCIKHGGGRCRVQGCRSGARKAGLCARHTRTHGSLAVASAVNNDKRIKSPASYSSQFAASRILYGTATSRDMSGSPVELILAEQEVQPEACKERSALSLDYLWEQGDLAYLSSIFAQHGRPSVAPQPAPSCLPSSSSVSTHSTTAPSLPASRLPYTSTPYASQARYTSSEGEAQAVNEYFRFHRTPQHSGLSNFCAPPLTSQFDPLEILSILSD